MCILGNMNFLFKPCVATMHIRRSCAQAGILCMVQNALEIFNLKIQSFLFFWIYIKSRTANWILSYLWFVAINDLRCNVLGWFLDQAFSSSCSSWSLYNHISVTKDSWSGPFQSRAYSR